METRARRGVQTRTANARKILIVDDEEENINVVRRTLERAGYDHVWSTTDSESALGMFEQVQPDLVILDLEMPEMSGLEVMAALRQAAGPDGYAPIVILSGTTSPEAEWTCLALGARDFVKKPFRGSEFLLRLENVFEAGEDHRAALAAPQPAGPTPSATRVAQLAHDLNNLLTHISGFAELLEMDLAESDSALADLAEIQAAVREAAGITQELLGAAAPDVDPS